MDRRKLKRPKKPFCSTEHEYGDFIPIGYRLFKRCNHCPATLSKDEWLKLKINPIVKVWHREKVMSTDHIDLFNY